MIAIHLNELSGLKDTCLTHKHYTPSDNAAMALMQFFAFVMMSVILPSLRAEALEARANPIRRVVNMLQAMQKKVVAEGEKEEELFQKFI